MSRESKKGGMARRLRGRIPSAGFDRAGNAARRPFLLPPTGLRVFSAWPALVGRDKPSTGGRGLECQQAAPSGASGVGAPEFKPAAGIAAALPPWPGEKSPATRHFLIFRQALTLKAAPALDNPGIPKLSEGLDEGALESVWFCSSVAVVFVSQQNYNHSISGMAAISAVHARTFFILYPHPLLLLPPAGQALGSTYDKYDVYGVMVL